MVKLKHLDTFLDRYGRRRYYVRRGGVRIPLHSEPGTVAFYDEYEAALRGEVLQEPDRARARRLEKVGYIYFLRAGQWVKIGFSTDPTGRFTSLKTALPAPVTCLVSVPGSARLERRLHEIFRKHRGQGEWFKAVPELTRLMAQAAAFGTFRDALFGPNTQIEPSDTQIEVAAQGD
jgi:hypothetical protein